MDSMSGTLFQDKAQLVQFLRHSHTVCFVPHKTAEECLRTLSHSKDIAKILKEVGGDCSVGQNFVECML